MRVTIRSNTDHLDIYEDLEGVFSVGELEQVSLNGKTRVLFFNPEHVRVLLIDKSVPEIAVPESQAPVEDAVLVRVVSELVRAWKAAKA